MSKRKTLAKPSSDAGTAQYRELAAEIAAMVRNVRKRLAAAGQLEAFDELVADADQEVPSVRSRRTTKKQPKKGRK